MDVAKDRRWRGGNNKLYLASSIGVETVSVAWKIRGRSAKDWITAQAAGVGEERVIGGRKAGASYDVKRSVQVQIAESHDGGVIGPEHEIHHVLGGQNEIAGVGQHGAAQRNGIGAECVGARHGGTDVVKSNGIIRVATQAAEREEPVGWSAVGDNDLRIEEGECICVR